MALPGTTAARLASGTLLRGLYFLCHTWCHSMVTPNLIQNKTCSFFFCSKNLRAHQLLWSIGIKRLCIPCASLNKKTSRIARRQKKSEDPIFLFGKNGCQTFDMMHEFIQTARSPELNKLRRRWVFLQLPSTTGDVKTHIRATTEDCGDYQFHELVGLTPLKLLMACDLAHERG